MWPKVNLEAASSGAGGQHPMVSSHHSSVYWSWRSASHGFNIAAVLTGAGSTSNLDPCSCGPITNRALARGVIPYIQPPLLQYDPQFGDAFWNSSKYGMVTYLLRMMTSWAIVCSVWYLPPMTREVGVPRPPVCVCALVTRSPSESSLVLYYRKMKMLCSSLTE